ncbi:hypothetical protein FA15DRAFT_191701 [Coprinopsis marcescibilis]|uniref:Uncharacterized protein n=1 Tax=Coprinopsis marcescibilis TaxID=230819 RepID=A0A5C3LC23_COPMA|nr:hypothetical protein FA15DRAFT_191701 [Coprinopsis marcescibilis]
MNPPLHQSDDLDEFFVNVHARRMSTLSTTYPLPVDPDEVKRSELHHRMIQFLFSGKNYIGPVKSALQFGQKRQILDLGTGGGHWAIAIADEFPRAEVIGVDIAPIQPSYVPPNCTFEICDLQEFLPYPPESFDFIHVRGLHLGIRDYPFLLQEVARLLRPGGLLLLVEADLEPVIIKGGKVGPPQGTQSQDNPQPQGQNSHPNPPHSTIFASPTPSTTSLSQSQVSSSSTAPTSCLTTNRELNSILNPWPQTPVPGNRHHPRSYNKDLTIPAAGSSAQPSVAEGQTTGLASFPLFGSPRPSEYPSNDEDDVSTSDTMKGWVRFWSIVRICLGDPEAHQISQHDRTGKAIRNSSQVAIDTTVPRRLAELLSATGQYEDIVVRQANVPVGFWPSDPHLLTVGQLQWMDYELLLPALRPFLLTKLVDNHEVAPHPTMSIPSTMQEVDQLIQDAQHDLYYPTANLYARFHIVYASKRLSDIEH